MAKESVEGYKWYAAVVFFLAAAFLALLYYILTVPFGICILFAIPWAAALFLVNFGLPLLGVFFLARWWIRYDRTKKLPWQPDETELFAALTLEQERAKEEERAKLEATALERNREKARAELRELRRMDRLAMTYYIEDALHDGQDKATVMGALKQKGWPEEDIVAAFQACGFAAENL